MHPCVQERASGCQVQAGTPARGPRWTQQAKQPCQPCSKQTGRMELADNSGFFTFSLLGIPNQTREILSFWLLYPVIQLHDTLFRCM